MNKFNKNLHKAVAASATLIGSVLFLGLVGYFLSQKLDNINWFISLLILGAFVGLYESYKQISK